MDDTPLRIVIVDDEPLARAAVREYAAADPAIEIVADCGNGFEAVKAVAELKPDLVLLDVQMPKLDGLATARQLRLEPKLADVPIVMLTARTADKDIEAAFAEGVTDYITKPFAVSQMRARVRSWLARSAEVEK